MLKPKRHMEGGKVVHDFGSVSRLEPCIDWELPYAERLQLRKLVLNTQIFGC